MSRTDSILRESVRQACGPGGVHKFDALYAGNFEKEDGRPDMEGIRKAIDRAFTPLESAVIMANLIKQLRKAGEPVPVCVDTAPAAETQAGDGHQDTAIAQSSWTDPNHVRDIVFEARRVRMAMGKPITVHLIPLVDTQTDTVPGADSAGGITAAMAMADHARAQQPVEKQPKVITVPESEIDREIEQFAYGRTAYSSIDIIDFIRYLKDKGYSFQEYIVLEKIYVKIEERKKETISALEKEVEGLFNGARAPQEPEISCLIRRLRDTGLVFEEEEVRRMVRMAALRRA